MLIEMRIKRRPLLSSRVFLSSSTIAAINESIFAANLSVGTYESSSRLFGYEGIEFIFLKLVSISVSTHPASISPLRQPINCNKHRKIGQPHIGKIQSAIIDQRQSHVANDSVNTCTPESA